MSRYSEQIRDEYGRPVPGVSVYVYVWDENAGSAGSLESLTDDATFPLSNPLTTDEFGQFYFNAADGTKLLEFHYGGKVQFREQVSVGAGSEFGGTYGTAPPTTGAHLTKEIVLNSVPSAGASIGWVCVAGGEPGTWAPFGTISGILAGASGVFFDTAAGDTFTGSKISVPVDASLTTSAASIAFLATTDKSLDIQVKDSAGNVLKSAFSDFVVEATYTVRPFDVLNAGGVHTGLTPNEIGTTILCDGQLKGHPGALGQCFATLVNQASTITTDPSGGVVATGGIVVTSRYEMTDGVAKHTVTYPGPSVRIMTDTLGFTADIHEMPRLFSAMGLRFVRGDMTLTALKVSAPYVNATFGFLGDSITQGRFATTFANGFAAKIRAAHPGQVLIAGAPSAQTSDWKTRMPPFVQMGPKYAFVMLGTNDISNARLLADIQTDYSAIIASLVAGGIEPILLATPPKGSATVPSLNTWLSGLGHRFADTYTPLLGTGTSMNATYDNGDGIHPNAAGHTVIYNTIAAYITAQGLAT